MTHRVTVSETPEFKHEVDRRGHTGRSSPVAVLRAKIRGTENGAEGAHMTNQCVLVAFACAMLSVSTSARAQDGPEQAKSQAAAEITPYVFLGSGTIIGRWDGHPLAVGLTSQRRARNQLSSRRNQRVEFQPEPALRPARSGPGHPVPGQRRRCRPVRHRRSPRGEHCDAQADRRSVNAGGGLRVQTDENWGVRADARWFNDLGTGPERWRLYNGVTFGRARR